jgi:hypothetical protein
MAARVHPWLLFGVIAGSSAAALAGRLAGDLEARAPMSERAGALRRLPAEYFGSRGTFKVAASGGA